MKRFAYLLLILFALPMSSCELLSTDVLSEAEVADGLKEALKVGTENSVDDASITDGYFSNAAIKILFPEEAKTVENTVRLLPGGNLLCDELVLKLNRAAEDAAPDAEAIFINAISDMTIEDAVGILHGNDDAATQYLDGNTRTELTNLFYPHIEQSLNSVGANAAWTTVITEYNNIPFTSPVNTDLTDYTTQKALDGLFVLIADEELLIRNDVNARVSELLRKVFGELDE